MGILLSLLASSRLNHKYFNVSNTLAYCSEKQAQAFAVSKS